MKSYQERANQLVQEGNQARSAGRMTEAVQAYREAIALIPGYGSLNLVIGDMLFEQRAYAEAAGAYQETVDFAPDHDQAWASLGQCRLLLDERDAALEAFESALAANPDNPEANFYAAMLMALREDLRKAEEMLFKALSTRPAWEEKARQDPLLGPLFEGSRRLNAVGRGKRWWEVWK